jgi:hypothetical protein
MPAIPESSVFGGQTGADHPALDWANANGVPHGGWCPRGRKAEDRATGNRYQLKENPNANSIQRTEVQCSPRIDLESKNHQLGALDLGRVVRR